MDGATIAKIAEILVPLGLALVAVYRTTSFSRIKRDEKIENFQLENIYTKKDAERDIAAVQARSDKLMAEQEDRHRKEIESLVRTHQYQIQSIETKASLDASNLKVEIDDLKKRLNILESENYDLKEENKKLKTT